MNTTTEPASPRALVKEAMQNTGSVDWKEISEAVVDALDPADYERVLRAVLPCYVRLVAKDSRVPGPVVPPPPPKAPLKAVPSITPPTARRRHASHKVQAVREDWERRLHEIYPAADGQNKHLSDMTRRDLLALADRMRQSARATMARAQGFMSLADALSVHGVDTVAGLPKNVTQRLVAAV